MPTIIEINNKTPKIDSSVWLASNATVTGDVFIGAHSSVWFQVVIRGDVNKIMIGEKVNIQDGAIVHGTTGKGDTIIGDSVTIGHRAIIHGCQIANNVLIGMGAIILDDAQIQENVVVGAGSVVTQGKILESGFLYAGVPAKKIKPLNPDQSKMYTSLSAEAYVNYATLYKEQGA